MNNSELTIVSVYHASFSKNLLETSWDLARRLNAGVNFTWLVADNTSAGFTDKIDEKKFIVVPNAPISKYHGLVSQHHASGINACMSYVKTRFFLSHDSDFFIVRPNWIHETLEYMQRNNLAFFGVPYYVKDWQKYRYFPSVVGMFIDLEKIDRATIDWTPEYAFKSEKKVLHIRKAYEQAKSRSAIRKMIKSVMPATTSASLGRILRTTSMRDRKKSITSALDTGYRIYLSHGKRNDLFSECVTAVYRPGEDDLLNDEISLRLSHVLEKFLPENLCYFPKRSGYYTEIGFRERGYPDATAMGWEEYIWRDRPFGIHVHGSASKTKKRNRSEEEEIKNVQKFLSTFI